MKHPFVAVLTDPLYVPSMPLYFSFLRVGGTKSHECSKKRQRKRCVARRLTGGREEDPRSLNRRRHDLKMIVLSVFYMQLEPGKDRPRLQLLVPSGSRAPRGIFLEADTQLIEPVEDANLEFLQYFPPHPALLPPPLHPQDGFAGVLWPRQSIRSRDSARPMYTSRTDLLTQEVYTLKARPCFLEFLWVRFSLACC